MSELTTLIDQSKSFLVILGQNSTFDQWVAATSWYLSLAAQSKLVQLVTPVLPAEKSSSIAELRLLNGFDTCRTDLNNQNATISFNYSQESVDSVSYVLDEASQKFTLTIKPKSGFSPLNVATIQTGYSGSDAEVIFLVGVHNLEALGKLFEANQDVFHKARIVTIHSFKPEIAAIALTTDNFTCLAEATTQAIIDVGLPISPEVASNLLFGIESQTEWLSSLRTTAKTFELAALLLQAGAKRQPRPKLDKLLPLETKPKKLAKVQNLPMDLPAA